MEWSKLKNIVIFLLLGVNLILLPLALGPRYKAQQQEKQAVADAILFLEKNGISVEPGVIPTGAALCPMLSGRDAQAEAELAEKLLKNAAVQSWGGEVYRYGTEECYIQFHSNGDFQALFPPDEFPTEGRSAEAHAVEFLDNFSIDAEVVKTTSDGTTDVIFVRQLCGGRSVLNCQVTLTYQNGALIMVSGQRVPPGAVEDTASQPLSVATALIRFYHWKYEIGDVYSAITEIVPAYTASSAGGEIKLTPVWRIVTNAGVYILDTMNGNVTRAS